jgi:tRNA-specific 2-thiouridylase
MGTVAVAVSGGVDSLVAARRLLADGHDVVGLHFTTGFEGPGGPAPDALPVHAIGRQLGIPIRVVDLAGPFSREVVDYFCRAYAAGLTPNPCLVCNPVIKFGVLLEAARRLGAEALATGHYARVRRDGVGTPRLFRGVDPVKEQSYFLSRLTPEQLLSARFPLGGLAKTAVVAEAKAAGLTPASPGESQDVCFLRGRDYREFLASTGRPTPGPGPIVDPEGRVIGRHDGCHLYTVGQRRGINLPAAEAYYVLRIEAEANRIVVGHRRQLAAVRCTVGDVNWIHEPARFPAEVEAQLRYRHRAAPAVVRPVAGGAVSLRFRTPQNAVTPGQGAVFYRGDEVLGGGFIRPEEKS